MEERGVELYPAQEEAVIEIFDGAHVVLDTPTGSGKSLVAVAALFKALSEGRRAVYTAPTKALVSEKFFDLCRLFSPEYVGMATGDVSINNRAPLLVCTAEILTSIALREGRAARLDHVVMDEFHYYGDAARGAAWEIPLWRLPQAAFLLMSGTLGANPQLYESIEAHSGRPVRVVSSSERPVPLRFSYAAETERDALAQLVADGRFPVYAVHFSQREAVVAAHSLAGDPAFAPCPKQAAKLQSAVGEINFGSPFGAELKSLVLRGIGVHHAGLLPRYRRLIERLAQQSLLTVVCGTDTLGVGVNVPIRSVLFSRLCKFDGEDTRLLRSREFHQIAGRAGRRGFDDSGDVVALDPEWMVLNEQLRQKRLQNDRAAPPRWQRPPRRNYKHWERATFQRLQRRPPDALHSQFQLTLGWVLELCRGAWQRGISAEEELRELVRCAQCSRSQRRYWMRQATAFLGAVERLGLMPDHEGPGLEPSATATEATEEGAPIAVGVAQQPHPQQGVEEELPKVRSRAAAAFADDTAPFLMSVLPALQAQISEEDFPIAVLAAVEALCPAPPALLRCLQGQGSWPPFSSASLTDEDAANQEVEEAEESHEHFGLCPGPLEDDLLREFTAYRAQNPWVDQDAFQPKGLAIHMFMGRLSFAAVTARLGGAAGAAVIEGPLLRYLHDVYRSLQRSTPDACRSASGVREVQAFLRSEIVSVDSSLISEYESLRALEKSPQSAAAPSGSAGAVAASAAALDAAAAASGAAVAAASVAAAGSTDATGGDRGAMVPSALVRSGDTHAPARQPRTREQLRAHVAKLQLEIAGRRKRREEQEAARKSRLSYRLRRWLSSAASATVDTFSSVFGIIW